MPYNAAGYFFPSYLDYYTNPRNGNTNYVELANTLPRVGPILQEDLIESRFRVQYDDIDVLFTIRQATEIVVTADTENNMPNGVQVGFVNASNVDAVLTPAEGVTLINGDNRFVIPPQKVGNLVKLNANFWLLSLGTGSGGSTPDGVPDACVIAFSPDKSKITWTAPDSPYPILNYAANVTPEGVGYRITGTTLFIDSPLPNVDHTFEVYAVNQRGNGPMSNLLRNAWTPPLAPSITSLTPVAGGFTAVWSLIAGSDTFIVQYRKKGDPDWLEKPFASPTTTGTVQGLPGTTLYEVRVCAQNVAGRGAFSAISEVTTKVAYTDQPVLAHSGNGAYRIVNFNPQYVYKATVSAGAATLNGDTYTLTAGNTYLTVESRWDPTGPAMSAYAERQQYTFRRENRPYPCGSYECNCRDEYASCGCECSGGGCGCYGDAGQSFGQCGCPGVMCWYNKQRKCDSCTSYCDNWVDVKNDTPSGYVDEYGEWSRTSQTPFTAVRVEAWQRGMEIVGGTTVEGWLPIGVPPEELPQMGDVVLVITVGEQVVRYYTPTTDFDEMVLCFANGEWGYRITDTNVDWFPPQGCSWEFLAYSKQVDGPRFYDRGRMEVVA